MLNKDNIDEKITRDAPLFWPDFPIVAYALYNKSEVFLYNHPKFPSEHPYYTLKWNAQFNGANTIIMYENQPTAIVNLDFFDNMENVYSTVLHELFHGVQHLNKEKRFPNELLGITYPLSAENIEFRSLERYYLYHAFFSQSYDKKKENLNKFISIREKRRTLIEGHFDYEAAIESVEGPAFYVELHADSYITSKNLHDSLQQYGENLLDKKDSTLHLRKSCYSSGLFLTLLLDEFDSKWKENYFQSNHYLYDLLKKASNMKETKIEPINVSKDAMELIDQLKAQKKDVFHKFEKQHGYHVFIQGTILSKGFDPMNIIADENRLLHQHFLTFSWNNKTYHYTQPIIAYCKHNYQHIEKLYVVLKERPTVDGKVVHLDGIGEIEGSLIVENGYYYVRCMNIIIE